MNELQVFKNDQFGQIRMLEENGRILFCGSDAAKALGYSNPRDALARHCRGVVKRDAPTASGLQEMSFIPEGDLYRLITHSKLPSAEQFERWVFDDVLPSVRKHGGYLTPAKIEEVLLNPDTIIKLATALKEEQAKNRELAAKVEEDKPKVLFADAVAASEGTILVGELAKILKGNGVEIGQNRLFERLRNDGYLIKRRGTDYNMPTQRAMEMGLFKIKETTITHPDGHVTVSKTPKVTGKGQRYFVNLFLGKKEEQVV